MGELTELLRRKEKKLSGEKEMERLLKETQVSLAEARDDIANLEDANGRLKAQEIPHLVDAAESDHDSLLKEHKHKEDEEIGEIEGLTTDVLHEALTESKKGQEEMKSAKVKPVFNYSMSIIVLILALLYFYIMV